MRKKPIYAVYGNELEEFLQNIGELHDIITLKRKCIYCNQLISLDNLFQLFPQSGSVRYICKNKECIGKHKNELKDILNG